MSLSKDQAVTIKLQSQTFWKEKQIVQEKRVNSTKSSERAKSNRVVKTIRNQCEKD